MPDKPRPVVAAPTPFHPDRRRTPDAGPERVTAGHARPSALTSLAPLAARLRVLAPDVGLAGLLALLATAAALAGARLLDPILLDWDARDVWFHSDAARVFSSMTDRWGPQFRTYVHPLFPLLTAPPVYALRRLVGLEALTAVQLLLAVTAGLWLAVLFVLLRCAGCRRLDATLFSLVAAGSAASVFWFTMPETYSFGSLTMLASLLVLVASEGRTASAWLFGLANALTLSCTTTNWMAGLVPTFVRFPWRRALQITVNAFCLVVVLWAVQKQLFPSVQFFLAIEDEERHFMLHEEAGGPGLVLRAFFVHSMVMPAIRYERNETLPLLEWRQLRIQRAPIGSGSRWGTVAALSWLALLGLGVWGGVRGTAAPRLRLALALLLTGQLALHLLYGEETFLYALHYLPLLVLWAALATGTRLRPLALALGAVLLVSSSLNNVEQFRQASAFVAQEGPERHAVLRAMQQRPTDPWPRGVGHVILAWPGTAEADKAYHEPGGSFSPGVGSFGLSLWVREADGTLRTSSEQIPLEAIRQRFASVPDTVLPGLHTQTPWYEATWTAPAAGRWRLRLRPLLGASETLEVVIRSVGPAGGRISTLDWNEGRLLVNRQWTIRLDPPPREIHLGEEGTPGWLTAAHPTTHWEGAGGWGYARLQLSGAPVSVLIEEAERPAAGSTPWASTPIRLPIQLTLPDPRFAESLNAQTAQLLMGVVGLETRPADPSDYPFAWQREAAYIVVALARAGLLEAATLLSRSLAERDFFGGFGPEADAPGLALWALEQLAALSDDRAYDEWLWPHLERKAGWIVRMHQSTQPVRASSDGPLWYRLRRNPERDLVAEPSRGDLVVGRMDNHRPLLYVNAVNIVGLRRAAAFAARQGHVAEASVWQEAASTLEGVWHRNVHGRELDNDRSYSAAFWPAGLDDPTGGLRRGLARRWQARRDTTGAFRHPPLWPAAELAEAHQWLALGDRARALATLDWFWTHPASPGLYSWWEGQGAPYAEWKDAWHRWRFSFHRWRQVRGWVNPPHVTPHYGAAAQMALLQLDMLTALEGDQEPPTLVIGAGLPAAWLRHPLIAEGLPVPGGRLAWRWDGQQVTAILQSRRPIAVRLASVFPVDTALRLTVEAP